ncbi:SH2 domain-containing protein 1A-like isoform X2 [Myripristis murdjan]|uniref:SH2 domain-containing protein 1A-like isoform X2 n=1 Tax=Myripristis murdjan TaxID=586833 RepID=UPI001175E037|nr:SH2 domain-containing protein 1A-like isoform X2 [Myripristis murdjan]
MGSCLHSIMEREGVLVRSIYYGKIGSEATERLMERYGHEGSFLLRDSDTVQGAFCLCVRQTPFVQTYRLIHSTDGWCLQLVSGSTQQRFRTLETLIETYRRGTVCNAHIAPLRHPLVRAQLGDISLGQEPAYMEM